MKYLFAIVLLLGLNQLYGQAYQCDDSGTVDFTMVECSNDFITFTVTTTNGNSTSGRFVGLPPGSMFGIVEYTGFGFGLFEGNDLTFNVPAFGCAPVNAQFIIDRTENSQTCTFDVLIGETRNIPTLGQWGLILLAILLTIVGILVVKNRHLATNL